MGTRGLVAVATLVLAACSNSTPPPTLASGTTATTSPPTTSPATPSPTTSTTTTTTTTTAPPTTQSPDARLAEIERMVHEAHVGRVRAMYDKDPDALLPWVGSQHMFDSAVEGMNDFVFLDAPTADNTRVSVDDVLLDRVDCTVVRMTIETQGVIEGADGSRSFVTVWWPNEDDVLRAAHYWSDRTPQHSWITDCDSAPRGVTP